MKPGAAGEGTGSGWRLTAARTATPAPLVPGIRQYRRSVPPPEPHPWPLLLYGQRAGCPL